MQKVLGRFSFATNVNFSIDKDNLHITIQSNSSEVDSKFDDLKTVLQTCYGDRIQEETGDTYQALILPFVDGGTVARFEKNDSGIVLKIKQLVTNRQFQDLSEREYVLMPLIATDTDSDVSFGFPISSWSVIVKDYYVYYSTTGAEYTYYYNKTFDVLSILGSKPAIGFGTNVLSDTGWIKLDEFLKEGETYTVTTYARTLANYLSLKFSLSYISSFSFFEDFFVFDWNYNVSINGSFSVYVEYSSVTNASQPQKCFDIPQDKPYKKEIVLPLDESYSFKIKEQVGLATSLLNYARVKLDEQVSQTLPKYSVDIIDSSIDIKDLVGSPLFLVDSNTNSYVVVSLVDATFDQNLNKWVLQFDDFCPFDVSSTYGFINDFREFSFRLIENENDGLSVRTFSGDLSGMCVYWGYGQREKIYSYEEKISFLNSSGTIGLQDMLSAIYLESDNSSLVDKYPFLASVNKMTKFPSPVLLGLPLQYVSQDFYSSQPYSISYLSLDTIPSVNSLGVVKPLVVSTPHPSGKGYILPIVLPNLVAFDIKRKLGYIPTKIFVNSTPDMVSDKEVFIASYIKDDDTGKYQIYLLESPIHLTKSTEIVRF